MERYGFGVLLYSFLNEEETDSPYYMIAKYLLENMEHISACSIQELAKQCNVSIATISRFCRKTGMENFFEMKMKLRENIYLTPPEYDFVHHACEDTSLEDAYLEAVAQNVVAMKGWIDRPVLNELVKDIHDYSNVGAFGAMHMENAARHLQNDMFRCRKLINVRSGVPKQIEYIRHSGKEHLLIVYTLSGNFMREIQVEGSEWSRENKPKIYVVTGNAKVEKLSFVDRIILLPFQERDYAEHPHTINLLNSLICLKYYENYIR